MTTTSTLNAIQSIDQPTEVTDLPKGRIEAVNVADVSFARITFEPGWRWSESVKPIAGTELCEFPHKIFIVSGALHVSCNDGTELDATPGDVVVLSPGHDAWVVGDEACVMYDFAEDDADYGKPPTQ